MPLSYVIPKNVWGTHLHEPAIVLGPSDAALHDKYVFNTNPGISTTRLVNVGANSVMLLQLKGISESVAMDNPRDDSKSPGTSSFVGS
jgi:hypothetical protein